MNFFNDRLKDTKLKNDGLRVTGIRTQDNIAKYEAEEGRKVRKEERKRRIGS